MAEKRQRINVNIYRASHNAEESQYIFDVEEELKKLPKSPGCLYHAQQNDGYPLCGKGSESAQPGAAVFSDRTWTRRICKDCQNGVADRVF